MKFKRIFAVGFILVILISLVMSISVSAANFCPYCKQYHDNVCPMCGQSHDLSKIDGINLTAYEWACDVYGGTVISGNTSCPNIEQSTLSDILNLKYTSEDADDTSGFIGLFNLVKGNYDILVVIGYMLVIIYVVSDLIEQFSIQQFDAETFFKALIKMVIGFAVLSNGVLVMELLMDFANALFTTISFAAPAASSGTCVYQGLADGEWYDGIAELITLLVPYLLLLLVKIIVWLMVWGRILELTARMSFVPIGVSDICVKGINGNGFRYIKKIVACLFQSAVLVALFKIYSMIMSSTELFGETIPLTTIMLLAITLLLSCLKSKDISEAIVGV